MSEEQVTMTESKETPAKAVPRRRRTRRTKETTTAKGKSAAKAEEALPVEGEVAAPVEAGPKTAARETAAPRSAAASKPERKPPVKAEPAAPPPKDAEPVRRDAQAKSAATAKPDAEDPFSAGLDDFPASTPVTAALAADPARQLPHCDEVLEAAEVQARADGPAVEMVPAPEAPGENGEPAVDNAGERRRRRRRGGRGRGRRRKDGPEAEDAKPDGNGKPATAPAPGPREPRRDQRDAADKDPRAQRRQDSPPRPRAEAPVAAPTLDDEDEDTPTGSGDRLMLINVTAGEECRIAIMHQNRLEELFMERASAESHVGNIYKGRVTNVEPSIQAAFVDFGLPKNGFLHISDLQPQYFPDGRGQPEEVGRKTPRRDRPPIQKCLRRGQEVIVQIIKEGIGTKGPTLTTYISIPGRYLVMMPGMNRLGVSRKIEDEDARRKMRKVLDELELPKDMGFILRTAGLEKTKRDLQKDQLYLQRLWKVVANRIKLERAPCELYRESDLVIRTIRDVYSSDFNQILVDEEETAEKVRDFLSIAMPRTSAPVAVHQGPPPLFHKFGVEAEIERINDRHVPLPSGGSLVIDSTEALVAIDVNSGRFRDLEDAEQTAYRINIEAAEEIARQLRLRDLGGLILCDFIDMRAEKHRRGVERALRESLRKHKERAKCLRMSQFGIIEMTRQRMRPSIKRSIYQDCPHCRGSGLVKNAESMTLDIMRLLQMATHHKDVEVVEVRVSPRVAMHLQNHRRKSLHDMESRTSRRIFIRPDNLLGLDQYVLECLDHRGGAIRVFDPPPETSSRGDRRPKRSQPAVSEELHMDRDGDGMFD